ncbi:MAG: hypothetical protein ABSG78_00545 [Verrucomicrobiota bacterium]|jgi:hypothetical protein
MNPISGSILLVLCLTVFCAPRRWALLAMVVGVLYVPQGAAVPIFALNIFSVRFLEVAGIARVLARGEFRFSGLNGIDRALLLFYGYTTAVFLVRSPDGQAFQIGELVDAYFAYFTFRGLIQDAGDFRFLLRSFVLLLIPYVAIVMVESFKHRNLFDLLAPLPGGQAFRGSRIRCLGSFRHPSLLGTIGVAFIPLYIGMAFAAADRVRALLGIVLCLVIVWASNSGGPLSGVGAGVAAWLCWRWRTKMKWVRRGIVAMIVMAALLMKAPVWYLLEHLSDITGGDGFTRAFLLDTMWKHLSVWWLAGMPITDTGAWFPETISATGGADITDQFVYFGIEAGVGAIALFIVLLTRAYRSLGKSVAILGAASPASRESEYFMWGMGCMLTAHVANWFGITYFDQTYMIWFMQLAAISALAQNIQSSEIPEKEAARAEEADLREAAAVSAQ